MADDYFNSERAELNDCHAALLLLREIERERARGCGWGVVTCGRKVFATLDLR